MSDQVRCLACDNVVADHHQAIDCDSCGGWQHRGCETAPLIFSTWMESEDINPAAAHTVADEELELPILWDPGHEQYCTAGHYTSNVTTNQLNCR
ncbi:hypothetical protein Pmani_024660 [Petrolisthes manimaculis]|uniref:Uncharacterized protein n=1 Tax=Petrolisthes manimaculis TaxID=1843537 RepID=A0AAE1TZ49_9EUCA|nr:hypothetical protein Pmani_024660 [Petrolisthes manimaculis]